MSHLAIDVSIVCFSVFDLKVALFSLTNVPPERQKILGLVKGKLPPDEAVVCVFFASHTKCH